MNLRRQADRLLEDFRHAKKRVKEEKSSLRESMKLVKDTEAAQSIIVAVAQKVQQEAHAKIASVVSKCLATVFDTPYEFRIDFERKRGKTTANLNFYRNGKRINPMKGAGGGVVDVAAFALRLACLVVQKPRCRRVLILDEPFKFVSERKEYRERVRHLIESLADEMNVQFIMVTHDRALEVGKVVELG